MRLYIHPKANAYSTRLSPNWLPVAASADEFMSLMSGQKLIDYPATRKMKGDQLVLKTPATKRTKRAETLTQRVKKLEGQIEKLMKKSLSKAKK